MSNEVIKSGIVERYRQWLCWNGMTAGVKVAGLRRDWGWQL